MPIVVQKYGGTSVGDTDRISAIADRIVRAREQGQDVVVVVSAMGRTTDDLLEKASDITITPEPRELDMLLTAGERIAMSLVAIAVNARGCRAASYTGSQAGIITDTQHGKARIVEIRPQRIKESLDAGNVVILAGFQGLSTEYDITTLGRGGSDTTAVAMAAALGADVCEIYTDVDGVFTADPRIVPDARKLAQISYEEMLEMASLGAKVLQVRSVKFATLYGTPIHVRSSFHSGQGTWVTREEDVMERLVVSGVTYNRNEAKITLRTVNDRPGVAARLFTPLSDAGIVVDMIVQNISSDGCTDMTFTVPVGDYQKALELASSAAAEMGAAKAEGDQGIAKVSIVGLGMKDHAGVAARMFNVLAKEGINIQLIATSEIKVSVVIEEKYTELAVRALHAAFVSEGATNPVAESIGER